MKFFSRLFLWIVILAVLVVIFREARHWHNLKSNYQKTYSQFEALKREQEFLEERIKTLQNEKELIKEARSQMNLVKDGEKVMVVFLNKTTSTKQRDNKEKKLFNLIKSFFRF